MSSGSSNLPTRRAPLDRSALERILARAAELQHTDSTRPEVYTEEQLLEVGREVGLSAENLRQAIAEERVRPAAPQETRGALSRFGPAKVEARRVFRESHPAMLQRLERWMEDEECLQTKRRFGDGLTWEARRDLLGSVKRGFNIGGRGYVLATANEIGATVTPVDDGSVLVSLTADYGNVRRRSRVGAYLAVGATVMLSAVLMAAAIAIGGGPIAVAAGACAMLVGAGVGVASLLARRSREQVARGELALEQALDSIEQRKTSSTPSVLGTLLNVAVRDLR